MGSKYVEWVIIWSYCLHWYQFEISHLSVHAMIISTFTVKLTSDRVLLFNSLRPRQNGRNFADDTFNRIFVNENVRISVEISLKFVPKGPINDIPALIQIMAWRRPGDNSLSEPVMVSLPTHICVNRHIYITRPQWVKFAPFQCMSEDTVLCINKLLICKYYQYLGKLT